MSSLTAGALSRRGFTLLEVLIAVLVFSFGLLGVAGMMLVSMRGNHTAQVHTQATFLAQWMGDAMRANPVAVIAGQYDGTATAAPASACTAGCTTQQAAQRDRDLWGTMIASSLPAGTGSIQCNLNSPPQHSNGSHSFPAGLCTITMTWSESNEAEKVSSTASPTGDGRKIQRFDWIINP